MESCLSTSDNTEGNVINLAIGGRAVQEFVNETCGIHILGKKASMFTDIPQVQQYHQNISNLFQGDDCVRLVSVCDKDTFGPFLLEPKVLDSDNLFYIHKCQHLHSMPVWSTNNFIEFDKKQHVPVEDSIRSQMENCDYLSQLRVYLSNPSSSYHDISVLDYWSQFEQSLLLTILDDFEIKSSKFLICLHHQANSNHDIELSDLMLMHLSLIDLSSSLYPISSNVVEHAICSDNAKPMNYFRRVECCPGLIDISMNLKTNYPLKYDIRKPYVAKIDKSFDIFNEGLQLFVCDRTGSSYLKKSITESKRQQDFDLKEKLIELSELLRWYPDQLSIR